MKIEHFIQSQSKLGEGPIWDPRKQILLWVDIHQKRVEQFALNTRERKTHQFDFMMTVLGLRAKGGFVFASDRGFGLWDGISKDIQLISNPEKGKPHNRFNDGAVDPSGRFWAGTMYEGPETDQPTQGSLYRLDPDLSIHLMETGLTISNGIGWSPDKKLMYLTDTLRRAIYVYEYEDLSGEISNRRVLIQANEEDGFPDGMAIDREGFIWSAFWGGWKVCRFDPDGKLERTIKLPVECPTCVTFGGAELNELFITTAWTALSENERAKQQMAGDVFRVILDVKGIEENYFQG